MALVLIFVTGIMCYIFVLFILTVRKHVFFSTLSSFIAFREKFTPKFARNLEIIPRHQSCEYVVRVSYVIVGGLCNDAKMHFIRFGLFSGSLSFFFILWKIRQPLFYATLINIRPTAYRPRSRIEQKKIYKTTMPSQTQHEFRTN